MTRHDIMDKYIVTRKLAWCSARVCHFPSVCHNDKYQRDLRIEPYLKCLSHISLIRN